MRHVNRTEQLANMELQRSSPDVCRRSWFRRREWQHGVFFLCRSNWWEDTSSCLCLWSCREEHVIHTDIHTQSREATCSRSQSLPRVGCALIQAPELLPRFLLPLRPAQSSSSDFPPTRAFPGPQCLLCSTLCALDTLLALIMCLPAHLGASDLPLHPLGLKPAKLTPPTFV